MSNLIHLARFGNRAGEHTLLSHTGASRDLLSDAVWRTDVPPHGDVERIGTFFTGYLAGDHYVVQCTKPDKSASRAGMVATTTAFVPHALLGAISLQQLLEFLEELPDGRDDPADVNRFLSEAEHHHPNGAAALASALLAHRRALWRGSDGLDVALGCLWRHLDLSDRCELVFGAAFHPEALAVPVRASNLLVLAVPANLHERWNNWPSVGRDTPPEVDRVRQAFFGEDPGPAAALGMELLGPDVALEHWRHLVVLADLETEIESLDHERLRSLLQLLGLLAPNPTTGAGLKALAVRRISELTPIASFDDIRGLRGVPWAALADLEMSTLLVGWTSNALGSMPRPDDVAAAISEITRGTDDTFRSELDAALRAAMRASSRSTRRSVALHVLDRGAEEVDWFTTASTKRADIDADLAAGLDATRATPQWLAALARKRGLPLTHALSVEIGDPVAGWNGHLRITSRTPESDAALANRLGAPGTIKAALRLDDAALTTLAADFVAADPELLQPVELESGQFRALWAEATARGVDPWVVVPAHEAVEPLLDVLVAGDDVPAALLDALSRTNAADLSDYGQRGAVWDRLPSASRSAMLTVTANALGRRMRPGDPTPEAVLTDTMLHQNLLGPLAHDDVAQAVHLIRVLPAASPEHAVIVARRGRFDAATASALGDVLVKRRWKRAAESIVDLAARRPDLAPVASRVSGLFSVLERLRRYAGFSDGIRGIATEGELRDALYDLVATLYSAGPTDRAVWERAGGLAADCPDASTPRHRWGLALAAIDEERSGTPKLVDLLGVMSEDYPNNHDVQTLSSQILKDSE